MISNSTQSKAKDIADPGYSNADEVPFQIIV